MASSKSSVTEEWKAVQEAWYYYDNEIKRKEVEIRKLQDQVTWMSNSRELLVKWLKTHE